MSAGNALGEIRTLTGNFELPPYACSTVRALYEGLQVLEADLHVHIHPREQHLVPTRYCAGEALAFTDGRTHTGSF